MALIFPPSPTLGQTYQSGSSPTYTWNGSVWALSSANLSIASINEYTASLKQALQITGSNSTMLGNLNVQGTQTALNQTSLQISDKTIRIASGSTNSSMANGAGILIDGANVTMSWDSVNSLFNMGTQLSASKFYGDGSGLTGVTSYTNSDNLAYLNSKGVISGSSQINNLGYATTSSVTIISASAWGAFQSASSYSSSLATSISASNYNITINSASVSSLSSSLNTRINTSSASAWGAFQSASSYSSSLASTIQTLSSSVDSRLDNQEAFSSSLSIFANKSTKILDAYYTGSNAWSGSYTGNGGTVKVEANFTMFYNTTGTRTFTLYRDGVAVDSGSFYFNQSAVHTVMPTLYYIGNNETGTHTYSVGHNGTTDVNDSCNIVVTEIYNQSSTFPYIQVTGSTTLKGIVNVGTGSGLEGGEIDLAYAQTTTLTGSSVALDVYADKIRIFENGGNSRGVSIDLSKAPTGVGGELAWKASGFVNAGVSVTLDDIQARVTTSGGRSLEIRTTGTSFTAMASAHTTYNNGSYTYYSDKSFTMSTTFGYPGGVSWGFASDGDLAVYYIRDTTNLRFWRITLMIGFGYNNNFITIERLH